MKYASIFHINYIIAYQGQHPGILMLISLGHLSFPFVQSASSDVFPPPMVPLYSHISETNYDDQHKVKGVYGTQSYTHGKLATSTVSKSSSCGRKSAGSLVNAPTIATSLQNIFKPVGGGGGKPVKDPFMPRYSPTDSHDNDKLLDIGDENM